MAFHTEGQGFQALQEEERMEGRQRSTCIPQQDGPNIGGKGGWANSVIEGNSMVAWVRLADPGILAAGLPVELAAFHDHAADPPCHVRR